MANIEIDEAELAQLRGAKILLDKIRGHPKARGPGEEAIKIVEPSFVTEHERAEPIRAEAKAIAEETLKRHLKDEENRRLEENFQSQLNSYRLSKDNPNGYTDEGIEEIKNTMRKYSIPDVEAAVLKFEKMHPKQPEPPSGYQPMSWNFGAPSKDEKTKLLFENEDAFLEQEAKDVWAEARRGELTD